MSLRRLFQILIVAAVYFFLLPYAWPRPKIYLDEPETLEFPNPVTIWNVYYLGLHSNWQALSATLVSHVTPVVLTTWDADSTPPPVNWWTYPQFRGKEIRIDLETYRQLLQLKTEDYLPGTLKIYYRYARVTGPPWQRQGQWVLDSAIIQIKPYTG
jgi:hypothetical protein